MVQKCCVSICRRRQLRGCNVSFHKFPTRSEIKIKWLAAVNRSEGDLLRNKDLRVCSQHFRPSDFKFGGNVKRLSNAAVPTININASNKENISVVNLVDVENTTANLEDPELFSLKLDKQQLIEENASLRQDIKDKSIKVESLQSQLLVLQKEIDYLLNENKKLKEDRQHEVEPPFSVSKFKHNSKKILYYTGFETFAIFTAVYQLVLPAEERNMLNIYKKHDSPGNSRDSSVSCENQFFVTMIRLRRGFNYETLGDLFGVCKATAAKICLCWINLMFLRLGALNLWPSRNVLINNAPVSLDEKYHNIIGSIDCTEFYIQKPSSLVKQSECYSHYKSSTTLKSLLMTDTNGGIIYMSPLFTGSISDKSIVMQSGFLEILKSKLDSKDLLPGDIVLADKGFKISSLFEELELNINIPTFRISGTQFSEEEVQWIRDVAHERIHVERAIGRLKQYRILTKKIPVALLGSIEQIYTVCCILTNFRKKLRH